MEPNLPLYETYPFNSVLELTLSPGDDIVRGLVYCTDEISHSIVLKRTPVHTTVNSEVRIINASCVTKVKVLRAPSASPPDSAEVIESGDYENNVSALVGKDDNAIDELSIPLPNVSRRDVEEREKRAIRLAEESFGHINQEATPEGQAVFDRLLKACNEVVWEGDSILVVNQVRVNPPYGSDDCTLLLGLAEPGGELNKISLDRVKRIVGAGRGDEVM